MARRRDDEDAPPEDMDGVGGGTGHALLASWDEDWGHAGAGAAAAGGAERGGEERHERSDRAERQQRHDGDGRDHRRVVAVHRRFEGACTGQSCSQASL